MPIPPPRVSPLLTPPSRAVHPLAAESGGVAVASFSASAWWRILRPGNAFIAVSAVLVGAFLMAVGPWPVVRVSGACVAAFAFAAAGNVRNDMRDVVVDRVVHPERPLVAGSVSMGQARVLAVALYALAVGAGAFVGWGGLLLVAAAVPVMEGYERWLKARGLPGNLSVGLLTAAPFVLGGLAVSRVGPALWVVAALAASATVGREVLKDVEDVEGDAAHRRTLPMRVGVRGAALVACVFLLAAAFLSPAPFLLENVLGWAYLPAVAVAGGCFVVASVAGFQRPALGQRLAKVGMVLALVALVVGRVQSGGGF